MNTFSNERNSPTPHNYIQEDLVPTELPYKHLRQSLSISCGVCSFLMALSGLKSDYIPNIDDEKKITQRLRHMRGGIPIFEIIRLADEEGLQMHIFYEKHLSDFDQSDSLVRNFCKTLEVMLKKRRAHYREGVSIDRALISKEVVKGRYVLVNGTTGGIPHMRMCFGSTKDSLLIADPLNERKEMYSKEDFEDNCSPPFGKMILSLSI